MRLASIFGILILTILGVIACQYSLEKQRATNIVYPILKDLEPRDSTFSFLAEEGFEHQFATGTSIKIPGGVLTDEQGQLINGLVDFSFCEYKDAVDLLLSGIHSNTGNRMTKTAGAFNIPILYPFYQNRITPIPVL